MAIVSEDVDGIFVQLVFLANSNTTAKLKAKAEEYKNHIRQPDMPITEAIGHVIEGIIEEGWTLK